MSLLFDTLMLGRRGQLSAAEKSYGELLKLSPTRIVYTVGLELQKDYFLDAQGAVDFIDRIPEKLRSEDAIAAHAALALIFVGRGAEAVATLNRLPRDYISEFLFNLPKGQIAGLAHEVAGQPAAAAVEWRNALSLVEKRLAAEPSNLVLLGNKAQLQAMLGQKAAALETLQLHIELGGKDNPPFLADRVRVLVRCGITEDAVEVIEREWPNANLIRRNALIRELVFLPEYATFRKDKHIAPLIQAHQAFVKAARAAPGSKP